MAITANDHEQTKAQFPHWVEVEVEKIYGGCLKVTALNQDGDFFLQDEQAIEQFLTEDCEMKNEPVLRDLFDNGWDVLTFMGTDCFGSYVECYE